MLRQRPRDDSRVARISVSGESDRAVLSPSRFVGLCKNFITEMKYSFFCHSIIKSDAAFDSRFLWGKQIQYNEFWKHKVPEANTHSSCGPWHAVTCSEEILSFLLKRRADVDLHFRKTRMCLPRISRPKGSWKPKEKEVTLQWGLKVPPRGEISSCWIAYKKKASEKKKNLTSYMQNLPLKTVGFWHGQQEQRQADQLPSVWETGLYFTA